MTFAIVALQPLMTAVVHRQAASRAAAKA